jgi:phosphoglycerate dehydrogenase-like enzyme
LSSTTRPKIVLAVPQQLMPLIMPPETLQALQAFAETQCLGQDGNIAPESLSGALPQADGLITSWGTPPITPQMLQSAPRLRIIAHSAGSVRPVVCREVLERGVVVTQAAYEIGYAVAEYTVGLILAGLRLTWALDRRLQQSRQWKATRVPIETCGELRGRTVGVIALSQVGQQVVPLLRPFGCRILAYDPYASPHLATQLGVEMVELTTLFEQSYVVTIHLPVTEQTRKLITADLLARLPDNALIVNTARGAVIDEQPLTAELQSGRLRAALDVTDPEPPAPDSPLYGLDNVLLTPHVAGGSIEARRRQGQRVVEDMRLFFSGQPLPRQITLDVWDRMA